jgi:hypothetical protein
MSEENKDQGISNEQIPNPKPELEDANISLPQPETDNQQPAIINMDTHAQELHKAPGQGWKHYFFEFFMLFLAVFCGFLVENQRERMVEHQREKTLITELVEDLGKDSAYLSWCINSIIPNHMKLLDSAITLLQQPGSEKDRETYQVYLTATAWNFNFAPTDRALSQLRSYGYRLIRNGAVADVISELEITNGVYSRINGHTFELQNDINESAYIFADRAVLGRLFVTEFPYPNDVSINLNDIPLNARVTKTNPEIQSFISKLKKYNFTWRLE